VLEVERTGQRRTGRKCRNSNEAVTGATSKAFARWLHHRYAPVELPSAEAYRFAARYLAFSASVTINIIGRKLSFLTDLSSIPSVGLSVRKVYCGKTADWIRMPFGQSVKAWV